MSLRRARAIAYSVVALLGVAAVFFTNPLPPRAITPAGEILTTRLRPVSETYTLPARSTATPRGSANGVPGSPGAVKSPARWSPNVEILPSESIFRTRPLPVSATYTLP